MKFKHFYLPLVLALCLAAILGPQLVRAITVGPVKLEYAIDPGATTTGLILVKNEENKTQTFYPSFESFTEQDGEKKFSNDGTPFLSWFKLPEAVKLAPGEQATIPFVLHVPKDAPPGGHFAVMWWSSTPPASASSTEQVAIQVRAGILIYLNISGDIVERAVFNNFDLADGRHLLADPEVHASLALLNQGNVYIKPTGQLKLTSWFGKTYDEQVFNDKGLQILPQSRRTFSGFVLRMPWYAIGPYTLSAELNYGQSNKTLAQNVHFWYLPWPWLSVVVLGLLLIILVLWWAIRRYNRWLLRQYQAGNNTPPPPPPPPAA